MDKQKQIEEIHKMAQIALGKQVDIECTKWAIEEGLFDNFVALYNAGYRKIPENAVVLTEERLKAIIEEEYKKALKGKVVLTEERNKIICDRFAQLERVQAELQELNAKYYNEAKDLRRELKRVRKETAEKFAERLKEMAYQSTDWSHGVHPMVVEVDYIDEIAEEFTEDSNGH